MADMSGYSLSDLKAVVGGDDKDGFMGGEGGWIGFLILFFLFFMNRGGGLFGNNGAVEAGVVAPAATQQSVDNLASRIDSDALLAAISGNKDAINALATSVGAEICDVEKAVFGVKSAVEQASAQTNLSICQLGNAVERGDAQIISTLQSCCCDMKTSMLAGFAGVDKTLCQTNFNMQTGFNGVNNTIVKGFSELGFLNERNTNTIVQAGNTNTQRIIDYLNASKEQDLRDSLLAAKGEISQRNQSDYILSQLKSNCCPSTCGC